MTMLTVGLGGELNRFPYYQLQQATAVYNPNASPTLVDGAISVLPDLTGNDNNATQGTAANRPLLSRSDNRENRLPSTDDLTLYAGIGLTSFLATTDPDGTTKAVRVIENSASSAHYIDSNLLFQATMIAGTSYTLAGKFRGGGRNATIYVYDASFFAGHIINTTTGAVVSTLKTGATVGTPTVTDIGDGWWSYSATITPTTTKTSVAILLGLANGSSESYLGNGTSYVDHYQPHLRITTADSTYIPTTTYPQYAGINGNSVAVFDGSNDSLTTAIAVNPTGGLAGGVVVRQASITGNQRILAGFIASANARFALSNNAGVLAIFIFNGNTVYIGRTTAAAALVANELAVITFTYDGSTSSSGLRLYKNGTRVDTTDSNAGVFTVPTAGEVLTMARDGDNARFLNGAIAESIFINAGTWSDADRQRWEQFMIRRYAIG